MPDKHSPVQTEGGMSYYAEREFRWLVAGLRPDNRVRQIAEAFLKGPEAISILCYTLRHGKTQPWRERAVAALLLGYIPLEPEQQPMVARVLEKVLKTPRENESGVIHPLIVSLMKIGM